MPRRILFILAIVLLAAVPVSSFAAYEIHLKDGTKFVTDEYFEEGDQIKFKRYGGLFGIEKNRVLEIVETDASTELTGKKEPLPESTPPLAPGEKEVSKSEAAEKEEIAGGEETDTGQVEEKDGNAKALTDDQKKLAEKYLKEFEGYKERFKNVNLMPLEELNDFYEELDIFRKTVVKKRLGSLFENELIEVSLMMERIQEVMKFKMG